MWPFAKEEEQWSGWLIFYAIKNRNKRNLFRRGSSSWARTNDPAVNSRMLCQLSYWGIWPNLHRVFMHFAQFGFCTLNSIFRVALLTLALSTELFRNIPLPDYSRNRASSGNYLLSRAVTHQVSSTWRSLTSVFGMGTGGPSLLSSPDFLKMLSHPQN